MTVTQNVKPNLLKKRMITALKFGFVIALLVFLTKRGFISLDATKRAFTQVEYIVPAFALLFFTTALGVIRWQWLLRGQNIELSWMRTLQLSFIGMFFNIALPGAVSGDFVKAFYVAKEVSGKRAKAFGSILFDRVAGLSALVLVSAGAMLLDYDALKGTALMRAVQFFMVVSAGAVVVFYTYLFLVREKHDPLLKLFRALEGKVPAAGSLTRIYESLRHYHNHRWIVVKVLIVSMAIHLCVAASCLNIVRAFGEMDVPGALVFVVVPLGLLVTAIPLTPAGVGTGHAAFGALFTFLGTQRGADVFSLFVLSQLASGAVGGLIYLRFRASEPSPTFEEPTGAVSSP